MNIKMKDEIAKYILQFGKLNDSELQTLVHSINYKHFEKGTFLLREGEFSENCYYVLKGCVRQFHIDKQGKEKTTEFYTENYSISPLNNYSAQFPSKINLECIEDSILTISNPSIEKEMYDEFPELKTITHKMMEQDFAELQNKYVNFISSSPEQRYLNLLNKRPYLFQRAPSYQIASYLGITPESLSRIKSRVIKKR